MKYTKITGTFLKFDGGQRIQTGTQYASQELKQADNKLIIRTFETTRVIETELMLAGPLSLDFSSKSDDPKIPLITGRFFDTNYEECVLNSKLPNQNISINGVVSKLDKDNALSTKTLTDSTSGKIIGIMEERVELISQEAFEQATSQFK